MRDFDKFFADRLNEEADFPRKGKNWKTLSGRLDAYDAGTQRISRPRLRYWQAAAAVSLLVTAWAIGNVYTLREKNTALQQQVSALQDALTEVAPLPAGAKPTPDTKTYSEGHPAPAPEPDAVMLQNNANHKKEDIAASSHTHNNPTRSDSEKSGTTNLARTNLADIIPEKQLPASQPILESGGIESSPTQQPEGTDQPDVEKMAGLSLLPGIDPDPVSMGKQPAARATLTTVAVPDGQASAVASSLTKPVHEPSRFKAGLDAMIGFARPGEKGVSMIRGQGLNIGYAVIKDIWLTASADWLRFDVATEKYHPHVHAHQHDPPMPPQHGGQPPKKLIRVESTQRQQHFALGVQYRLPLRSRFRPSVRLAHTWVHVSPELISFKFDDQHQGGPGNDPEFFVQKREAQYLGNVWRLGAGLEYEAPHWVFGLWTDYSKNFGGADPNFDILMFKAGIQYRIN